MRRRRSRPAPLGALRALGLLGVLTAVALIAGQLASVGHYVFVAHYLCSEHATLHHGHAPSVEASAKPAAPKSVRAVGEADHGTHDTCSFPAREREALRAPACGSTFADAALGQAPGLVAEHAAVMPAVPLLSQAPKQSPPADAHGV